jgi:uncharacterized damage-inducible protein DinB
MSDPSLSADALLEWNDATASIWRSLATSQPEMLGVPCDIYNCKSVGQLLQHIVAAELRYAERLQGLQATDYSKISYGSAEEIFATHERALEMLRGLLADAAVDWDEEIEFGTLTAGRRRATRKVVFQHALLHGVRHYAQLATLVRQHGYKTAPMDFLIMVSKPVE